MIQVSLLKKILHKYKIQSGLPFDLNEERLSRFIVSEIFEASSEFDGPTQVLAALTVISDWIERGNVLHVKNVGEFVVINQGLATNLGCENKLQSAMIELAKLLVKERT